MLQHPDELRTPQKTNVAIVNLEGYAVAGFTLDTGWRWSESIWPVVMFEFDTSAASFAAGSR